MAQTVDLWGATYSDVPALVVPSGNGTARFTDVTPTTAVDADVLSGKIYFKSDGTQSTGTGSGGVTPTGTIEIDDDGTYDVTNYASAEVAIDYVSKTVPVLMNNHSVNPVSCYRSVFTPTIVSASTGLITNTAGVMASNFSGTRYLPGGPINLVFYKTSIDNSNFYIKIGDTVKTPMKEWDRYKLYTFSPSENVETGWTIDIYDTSDPWPVEITAEALPVTTNGTYTAPSGTAYTPVTVNVPNTYAAGDEGKVVSNGTLVAQTSSSTSTNGTIDTTLINSLSVNVPTGIARTSSDLVVSGDTVTVPAGLYSSSASASVASGTAGTPTATKGTVSNHAISVTPSVTNTTGYISGGTINGTAVSVSASELVSGTYTVSASGTADVTNYASISVPSMTLPTAVSASGSGTTKATVSRSTSDQYINIPTGYNGSAANYKISAVANGTEGTPTATKGTVSNHAISVTPSVTNTAGYISGGTKTGTAVSVSASELVSGTYTVSASGTANITNYASLSVSAGTAGTPSASKGTVSNHSVSVTPSVTNQTGWITGSTKTGTAVTVSASELVSGSETKSANGTYDVTNLASLVVAVPIVTYYTGSGAPSSSLGSNGDIYLRTS